MDPLRDEALVYERLLREDIGIKTKLNVYPGVPHGFWSVFPSFEGSKKFVAETVDGIAWLLEASKP
jgi:acetyl esterase/lipase